MILNVCSDMFNHSQANLKSKELNAIPNA